MMDGRQDPKCKRVSDDGSLKFGWRFVSCFEKDLYLKNRTDEHKIFVWRFY